MNRNALHATRHLRNFRLIFLSAGLLVSALAATGIAAVFAPPLAQGLNVTVAAGLATAGFVAIVLFFAGYYDLRAHLRRAAEMFESGIASAQRDALTGALNRACFLAELKTRLRAAAEQPLAFVQIDMDHLKQMNDGSGHAAGDCALQHLTATIEQTLPDAVVGRLGGDEFGVIISGHDNVQAISRVCRQMLDTLSKPTLISGRYASLSASAGFAVAPLHASQTDDLMSKADLALYKGKSSGRNAVIAFDEDMHRDERHRRFIERELRAAIMMEELDLHYQPILLADGHTLKSYEALVRWNHPVRGLIPPSEFIPIAESSELIDRLGEWVLKRACADYAALQAPSISVNVSPVQLRRPDFSERFAAILEAADVTPAAIAVEITENVPLTDEGAEKANLDGLKRLGVRIAIDDFGSGNASLSYLRRTSFDILKIDRSYVENVVTNRFDSLMIASICRIARAANMTIIAEGIETEAQMHAVTDAGVTALQGFYHGRPQPLAAILAERQAGSAANAA